MTEFEEQQQYAYALDEQAEARSTRAAEIARAIEPLREALRALHSVLRDRHHGRMPYEVQVAYDMAGELLQRHGAERQSKRWDVEIDAAMEVTPNLHVSVGERSLRTDADRQTHKRRLHKAGFRHLRRPAPQRARPWRASR